MTKPTQSDVTVDTTFEVGFKLPSSNVRECPPEAPGTTRTLDRELGYSAKEIWRIIFDLDDAEEVAATFEEVAKKIRAHIAR